MGGKVAIVTGAASGIGRACAVASAANGAAVVANDLSSRDLAETVATVEGEGGTALAVPGDVRSWRDVASLVSQARSTFGGLDVMVANAAVSIYAEFEQIGEEDLDIILDTNLRRAT